MRLLNETPLWLRLITAAVATWRLSSLFVHEDGPGDVFRKIRDVFGVYILGDDDRPVSQLGRLLACVWCLSVWIALVMTVVMLMPIWFVMIPFALSAIAIWIEHTFESRWP